MSSIYRILITCIVVIVLAFAIKSLYFSGSLESTDFENILVKQPSDLASRNEPQPTQNVQSPFIMSTQEQELPNTPLSSDTVNLAPDTFSESELFINDDILVRLLGTRLASEFLDELALLEVDGELYEMKTNDIISQYSLRVDLIANVFVEISIDEKKHTVTLTDVNLLLPPTSKTHDEYMAMTEQEISSRPRILEHIVSMQGLDLLARGAIVSPGLNPDLFNQAQFEVDDVLLKVNGIELNSQVAMQEAQAEIKRASSLEFEVLRKGKTVTLFLDIPAESLIMSQ